MIIAIYFFADFPVNDFATFFFEVFFILGNNWMKVSLMAVAFMTVVFFYYSFILSFRVFVTGAFLSPLLDFSKGLLGVAVGFLLLTGGFFATFETFFSDFLGLPRLFAVTVSATNAPFIKLNLSSISNFSLRSAASSSTYCLIFLSFMLADHFRGK